MSLTLAQASRAWRSGRGAKRSDNGLALRRAIVLLASIRVRPGLHGLLAEQPFDGLLLQASPLYRRSRELYAESGEHRAALVSSPRALSSPTLLAPLIEYSPIARELAWAATDPRERRDLARLLELRGYVTSVFHEQNHRILWRALPPPPAPRGRDTSAIRRYLHLAESLVIALDMALADDLAARAGDGAPALLYLTGAIYDPGTPARADIRSRRAYRNHLHAARHATWLALEMYEPARIPSAVDASHPRDAQAIRAATRAIRLDARFITETNPRWQRQHATEVSRRLARRGVAPLLIDDSPADSPAAYAIAERVFEEFGL